MKTKPLLLLILVLICGIFVLERAGHRGIDGGPDAGPASASPPERNPERPVAPAPLSDAGSPKFKARSVAGKSQLEGGVAPAPQVGPQRTLKVVVEWPDAARPKGIVEVCIFKEDIGGAEVLRALTTNFVLPSKRSRAIDRLYDPSKEPDAVRERALAVAPLSENSLGRWTATLQIPRRAGRVFAHIAGATYYTPLAAIADVEAEEIVARPVRGGELRVRATAATDEVKVEGIPFIVSDDQSSAEVVAASSGTGVATFQLHGVLDERGEARLSTVPSGLPIKIALYPEASAQATVKIPAITPGTAETAIVKLHPGAIIAGRVVDPSGVPIAGAEVAVSIPGRSIGIDDDSIRQTTSDGSGSFRVEALPARELIVRASAAGWLEGDRSRYTLVEGTPLRDVELELGKGSTLTGTAVLPDGTPAVGAALDAVFDVGHFMGAAALNITRGATGSGLVEANGRFEVSGLGRGPFTLTCEWTAPDGTEFSSRQNGLSKDATGIQLKLTEPLSIEGTVVDRDGAPLADIDVRCARLLNGSMGDMRIDRQMVTSDEEGRFRFDVDQDRFELVVAEDTLVSLEPFVITVSKPETGVKILCTPAVSASGVVLDPAGSPVTGATVSLETGGSLLQAEPSGATSTRSKEDGTFKLVGIAPGKIILNAEADKLARVSTPSVEVAPGEALTGIVLKLKQGGAIEGLCFDNDGRTASGRILSVYSINNSVARQSVSDEDGTFRIEGLVPGTYQVVAVDPKIRSSGSLDASAIAEMWEYTKMASAEVTEGETSFVFLGAPPSDPVEVEGTVTQGGEPYGNALIQWLPASEAMQERMESAPIAADGTYHAKLNQAGHYVVTVVQGNDMGIQSSPVEFQVEVPKGSTKITEDFVIPGGGIRGMVRSIDGSPAAGVRVALTGVGAVSTGKLIHGYFAEIKTDASGNYSVDGLHAGTYQVSAGGASFLGASDSAPSRVTVGPLSLAKDQLLEGVDLRLREPGTIRVSVTDSAGNGVPGAAIFLLDEEGRHSEMFAVQSTDQGGHLRMNSVAPGTYTLAARTDELASEESLPVTVVAGETSAAELILLAGTRIEASAKWDGEAVPNALIQVFDSEGRDLSRRISFIDSQDHMQGDSFSVSAHRFGPFPPGVYLVKATSQDGRSGQQRVRLKGTKPKKKVFVKLK